MLDIGTPGAFDESGVLPTSIVQFGDGLFMYNVGYQLETKVKYLQFQGLAVSSAGGDSFRRARRVPVLDRSQTEPLSRTSALVAREDDVSRAWYVGGSESTIFVTGADPMLEAFEREFATAVGANEAVGVGNVLDALAIALRARRADVPERNRHGPVAAARNSP